MKLKGPPSRQCQKPPNPQEEIQLISLKENNILSSENLLVDIRGLKSKAVNFPEPARVLILSEPDELPLKDYILLQYQWEKILRMVGEKVNPYKDKERSSNFPIK